VVERIKQNAEALFWFGGLLFYKIKIALKSHRIYRIKMYKGLIEDWVSHRYFETCIRIYYPLYARMHFDVCSALQQACFYGSNCSIVFNSSAVVGFTYKFYISIKICLGIIVGVFFWKDSITNG